LSLLQKEVAVILKVTEDCITNWENNRFKPHIKYYPSIISFLGYNPFVYNLETIGGRIKYYRQIHGLNYKKMGQLLRVDASTISIWENNLNSSHTRPQNILKKILVTKLNDRRIK
jgi:DNA-binding XRE family transcriptional regulator